MSKHPMPRPGVTLNLCGVSCPGPILGAKKVLMELAQGEVMLLVSDCPATSDDLFSWAERTGNEVLQAARARAALSRRRRWPWTWRLGAWRSCAPSARVRAWLSRRTPSSRCRPGR